MTEDKELCPCISKEEWGRSEPGSDLRIELVTRHWQHIIYEFVNYEGITMKLLNEKAQETPKPDTV